MTATTPATARLEPGRTGTGATRPDGKPGRRGGIRGREGLWGWFFASPMIIGLGLFLLVPILMAAWVSLLNWNGQSDPFSSSADFVGLRNYTDLFSKAGLDRTLFMTSMRNTIYYVLLVVPLQTALALFLAMVVNQRVLKGKGIFRTAFYFPSVTSSIAVSTVFLFFFQGAGPFNDLLRWFGIKGPNWLIDPRGVVWSVLGAVGIVNPNSPPSALANHGFLGLSWYEWLSGPSIAMCTIIALAIWTTSGTFMLIFLAGLQDVPVELEEAARLDGVNRRQMLRYVTLPALRPVLFLVLTLGVISCWQVFDSVFVLSKGAPANTTLTPAFLSYSQSFTNSEYGQGAAIAFVLLTIIIGLTVLQRFLLRERAPRARRNR